MKSEKNMGFVIWLSSSSNDIYNAYGYWSGKNYVSNGELFPITDNGIENRTKVYSSKKRAEMALNACLDRGYAYVYRGEVRPVNR